MTETETETNLEIPKYLPSDVGKNILSLSDYNLITIIFINRYRLYTIGYYARNRHSLFKL
jgi:hypothetical protein